MDSIEYETARRYLEVSGQTNAIDNLEMALHCLTELYTLWKWKWVIIALFQAVYSIALCLQAGTSAKETVIDRGEAPKPGKKDKRSSKQLRHEAYAMDVQGYKYPEIANKLGVKQSTVEKWLTKEYMPEVLSFWPLMERLQTRPTAGCQTLVLNKDTKVALQRLKYHRDHFEHRMPREHWSIQIELVTGFLLDVLPVARFLALESNDRLFSSSDKDRIEQLLISLEKQLRIESNSIGNIDNPKCSKETIPNETGGR